MHCQQKALTEAVSVNISFLQHLPMNPEKARGWRKAFNMVGVMRMERKKKTSPAACTRDSASIWGEIILLTSPSSLKLPISQCIWTKRFHHTEAQSSHYSKEAATEKHFPSAIHRFKPVLSST